jgi:hypothetical protein
MNGSRDFCNDRAILEDFSIYMPQGNNMLGDEKGGNNTNPRQQGSKLI